ncbi:Uncharacterised nucleotidyltransferase [Ruminococcus albus]|uniref:Uncharacterized nucleotidyltransferase n=2 Tax=Ruminococcus albus TaxID=1264 RepID=A0A1H7KPK4_RUMAL|nr:Uncharacterised nucleotidyltransferase [Ruminococcus albus]
MKLTTTQVALLEAIKASLFGTEPNYSADTDWDEVIKEAKAQTVLGIISPVIPVKDVSVEMGKATYMRILFEQDKLVKLLDANDIPCVILKGSAAAQYYPKPYLRAMGDIDVLVTRAKFEKAVEVLESNGYIYDHNKDENGHMLAYERNIVYKKNGIIIELHHHFSSEGFDMDDILEQSIDKREYRELDGYKIPVLPDIENGLVLLGHINQHMRGCDLGLRQIIDWEIFIHKVMDRDLWENTFIPIARSTGLDELALNTTAMCIEYCGLPNDLNMVIQSKKSLAEYLDIIFETGNFGIKAYNSSKKKNDKRIMYTAYNIKSFGFFRYFQNDGLRKWSLCKKYPFLIHFAWIYGIVRTVIKGISSNINIKSIKKEVKNGNDRLSLNKNIGVKSKNT